MDSDAAYSICKTRLGISVCNFDDAWTTNGLIATTPPFDATQSTGVICAASSRMLSSVSTPSVCVPGRTRRGPLRAVESSQLRRNASTSLSALAGASAQSIPSFTDHGPQPGWSIRSRSGKAVSWCHTTSQFAVGDLSKSVARKGNAAGPRTSRANPIICGCRATAATGDRLSACRMPARLRRGAASSISCRS